jgi:hypothetical protein
MHPVSYTFRPGSDRREHADNLTAFIEHSSDHPIEDDGARLEMWERLRQTASPIPLRVNFEGGACTLLSAKRIISPCRARAPLWEIKLRLEGNAAEIAPDRPLTYYARTDASHDASWVWRDHPDIEYLPRRWLTCHGKSGPR